MNLLRYIQGFHKGKEAHRIEKDAMQDPFLADALEGYDSVSGNHIETIQRMQHLMNKPSEHKSRNIWLWTSIAASIVLVLGIGYYLLQQEARQTLILSEQEQIPSAQDTLELTESMAIAETNKKQEEFKRPDVQEPVLREEEPPSLSIAADEMEIIAGDLQMEEERSAEADKSMETIIEKKEILSDASAQLSRAKQLDMMKDSKQLQGKVVDEKSGEPLPGVNIAVKGTHHGTVTDSFGKFVLDLNQQATIVANHIGYESQEIRVDTAQLQIAMHEDTRQLSEVVTVGHRSRKLSDLADSSSATFAEVIVPEPVIGKRAYDRYLEKNHVRPTDKCKDVKGEVIVQFNVDKNGRPQNLTIKESLCDAADREAIRLITEGCNWTQGNIPATVVVKF